MSTITCTHLHLQMFDVEAYNILVYLQFIIICMATYQAWIALCIALMCMTPSKAYRVYQFNSTVASFSSGFFIPIGLIHWG